MPACLSNKIQNADVVPFKQGEKFVSVNSIQCDFQKKKALYSGLCFNKAKLIRNFIFCLCLLVGCVCVWLRQHEREYTDVNRQRGPDSCATLA